jgi:hypothetical protein
MKSVWTAILVAMVGLGAAAPGVAQAHEHGEHEKVISIDQIPPAAKAGLLREAKGAPIRRVEMEKKGDATVYEGVVPSENGEVGIMVDADGKMLGRHAEKNEHQGDGE